uniref:CD63 antigen-like n=1 Tax=Centroberyx gerrardi TaxID=166262 RepID=UPI003AAD0D85
MCCNIKYVFIFFNCLFLASGVALIIIGVRSHTTYSEIGVFASSGLSQTAVLLISVGVFITLISFLGFFGAFVDNSSMLATFICILVVIIGLEIITGIALYIFRSKTAPLKMNSAINNKARAVISEYNLKNRHIIDNIQEKFHCCGADGQADWLSSPGWGKTDAVPDSCCVVMTEACGQDISPSNIHKKGCIWAVKLFLLKNLVWVAAVCIALGVLQVLDVLFGMCLCLDIKRRSYEDLG